MKNTLIILSLSFLFVTTSCNKKEETKKIVFSKDSVNSFIDEWHKNAADANADDYFGKFSVNGIFIGTDATELWTINEFYDFAKPYFDKGKAWNFTAKSRNIYYSADSSVIWFEELLDTWMGDCRSSGVLQVINSELKIEHYQLSVTIDNDKMKQFLEISADNSETKQ